MLINKKPEIYKLRVLKGNEFICRYLICDVTEMFAIIDIVSDDRRLGALLFQVIESIVYHGAVVLTFTS